MANGWPWGPRILKYLLPLTGISISEHSKIKHCGGRLVCADQPPRRFEAASAQPDGKVAQVESGRKSPSFQNRESASSWRQLAPSRSANRLQLCVVRFFCFELGAALGREFEVDAVLGDHVNEMGRRDAVSQHEFDVGQRKCVCVLVFRLNLAGCFLNLAHHAQEIAAQDLLDVLAAVPSLK